LTISPSITRCTQCRRSPWTPSTNWSSCACRIWAFLICRSLLTFLGVSGLRITPVWASHCISQLPSRTGVHVTIVNPRALALVRNLVSTKESREWIMHFFNVLGGNMDLDSFAISTILKICTLVAAETMVDFWTAATACFDSRYFRTRRPPPLPLIPYDSLFFFLL
jgi:hypothetical protein